MADKFLLLLSFSVAAAAWPIADAAEEIAPGEIAVLAAVVAIVLAIQFAVLWLAEKLGKNWLTNLLVAAFVAANAYHFALLTLEAEATTRLLIALATGIVALAVVTARISARLPLIFGGVFTLLSLAQYGYGRVELAKAGRTLPPAAISLPVKSDRNVYLISMESLHSPSALRQLYKIDGPPHLAYLQQEGFRILDRAYSADTSTRRSYERILEFSKPLPPEELAPVFRSGNSTFRSFKDSGYRVQFLYVNNYLNVGSHVIDYVFPPTGFYVCDNVPTEFYYFACRDTPRWFVNRTFFGVVPRVEVQDEISELNTRVAKANQDDHPWLTISHIAFPRHTPKTHKFDDAPKAEEFRELIRSFMPQIADNYRSIVSNIKKHDPNAVIITYGDHGAMLTRGMKINQQNAPFTRDDVLQDRYGVMLAVYPADFCRNRISEGSTTSVVVKSVIQCLSGDDNPTAEETERARTISYRRNIISIDKFMALTK